MTEYTFNGITYDIADLAGYGFFETMTAGTGDSVPRFLALFLDHMADSTRNMATTSTSSVAIGTGTKSFVMDDEIPYNPGDFLVIANTANPTTKRMFVEVTARSGANLTVNSLVVDGSGTLASWTISPSGARGAAGAGLANVVEDTTPQLGGDLDGQDYVQSATHFKDVGEVAYSLGNINGAVAVDYRNGGVQYGTLTGNITSLTVSNWPPSGKAASLTLELTQDGTGSRTISLAAAYKTENGAGITLSTAASSRDKLRLETRDAGTTIDAFLNRKMS